MMAVPVPGELLFACQGSGCVAVRARARAHVCTWLHCPHTREGRGGAQHTVRQRLEMRHTMPRRRTHHLVERGVRVSPINIATARGFFVFFLRLGQPYFELS